MSNEEQIKQLLDEYEAADREASAAGKRARALAERIALLKTDLRPGDKVTYEGSKKSWVLTKVLPGYSADSEPRYMGRLLKKDGTPGALEGSIWQVPYGKSLYKIAEASP